jgi:hypothetical protein
MYGQYRKKHSDCKVYFPFLSLQSEPEAGWSSLEARLAHNQKVVGSNPTPATKKKYSCSHEYFFLFRLDLNKGKGRKTVGFSVEESRPFF